MVNRNQILFTVFNADGDEVEHAMPAKMEVCHRCEGTGTHTNPSIDGNGITGSEWAEWDEEDRETYMSGGYDVRCEVCDGRNVVPVADPDSASAEVLAAWEQHQEEEAEAARDYASEAALRRAESGGYY
jgi:RecJ-like exonuclease